MDPVATHDQWERGEVFRATFRDPQARFREVALVIAFILIAWGLSFGLMKSAVIGAVCVIVYVFSFFVLIPMRLWSGKFPLRNEITTTVSDEGISMKSGSQSGNSSWSAYKRSKESKEFYFLLRRDRGTSMYFLKRSFANPSDEARFRELLRAHSTAMLSLDP